MDDRRPEKEGNRLRRQGLMLPAASPCGLSRNCGWTGAKGRFPVARRKRREACGFFCPCHRLGGSGLLDESIGQCLCHYFPYQKSWFGVCYVLLETDTTSSVLEASPPRPMKRRNLIFPMSMNIHIRFSMNIEFGFDEFVSYLEIITIQMVTPSCSGEF